MGYRIGEHKHHHPHRSVQSLSTPADICINANTTASWAFPCWYVEVEKPRRAHHHSRLWHDHVGWPSPNHKDHCCQHWDIAHSCCSFDKHKRTCDRCHNYIDMSRLIPVHLSKEGYSKITTVVRKLSGDADVTLDVEGIIDTSEDWVVRLYASAVASGSSLPKETVFVVEVYAEGPALSNKTNKTRKDLVCAAKVKVLPGVRE